MFSNSNEFSLHIETLKQQTGLSFVDTIIDYCEKNMIDVEDITPLINKSLKEKIALEARPNYQSRASLEDVG